MITFFVGSEVQARRVPRPYLLCCVCSHTMIPDINIGAEGAKALAPALGRLSQLATVILHSE